MSQNGWQHSHYRKKTPNHDENQMFVNSYLGFYWVKFEIKDPAEYTRQGMPYKFGRKLLGFSTKGFPIICSGSSKVRTTKILCQNLEFWWVFFFRCVYRTHRIWKINHLPATFCQAEDGTFYRIQEFYLYIKLFLSILIAVMFFLPHMAKFKYLANSF